MAGVYGLERPLRGAQPPKFVAKPVPRILPRVLPRIRPESGVFIEPRVRILEQSLDSKFPMSYRRISALTPFDNGESGGGIIDYRFAIRFSFHFLSIPLQWKRKKRRRSTYPQRRLKTLRDRERSRKMTIIRGLSFVIGGIAFESRKLE
jgi:hypothetical protein